LVLCRGTPNRSYMEANFFGNELYVFGSNHFGQLGTGNSDHGGDTKTNLPVRLDVGGCSLRLIHTKFFTNVSLVEYKWTFSYIHYPLTVSCRRRRSSVHLAQLLKRRVL